MCIKDVDKINRKVSLKPFNVRVTAMENLLKLKFIFNNCLIYQVFRTDGYKLHTFTIFGLAVTSLRMVISAQILRGSIKKSFFSVDI